MKLRNVKVGKKFKIFKDGFTYKKKSAKEADVLDNKGNRLFGAIFGNNENVHAVT